MKRTLDLSTFFRQDKKICFAKLSSPPRYFYDVYGKINFRYSRHFDMQSSALFFLKARKSVLSSCVILCIVLSNVPM